MTTDIEHVRDLLVEGNMLGIEIHELRVLERIKDACFPVIGPLHVSVDMKREVFLLQRDYDLTDSRFY